MVFKLPNLEKENKPVQTRPLKLYRNPIYLAQEWQKMLDNGDYSSPADLAHKLGVSGVRVIQVLRPLWLAPEVLRVIAPLGNPLLSPIITERSLRPLVSLPSEEQKCRVEVILGDVDRVKVEIKRIIKEPTRSNLLP
jgi:hypothetical protein